MPEEIVENGMFQIPLFHGTSTVFLESILTHGLGGVNPIDVYGVRVFVRKAYECCETVLCGDAEWEACKYSPQWLINQESFGNDANFQHGDTYLTPSRASAVSYALSCKFGSELLSMGAKLVDLVRKRCPELDCRCFSACEPLANLISSESKPILVTVRNVSVDMVLSEDGNAPGEQIEKLKTVWPSWPAGVPLNINFRLRRALQVEASDIEHLDPTCETNEYAWQEDSGSSA